jgi:hypothetical protein
MSKLALRTSAGFLRYGLFFPKAASLDASLARTILGAATNMATPTAITTRPRARLMLMRLPFD